jgi:hypothetical protein
LCSGCCESGTIRDGGQELSDEELLEFLTKWERDQDPRGPTARPSRTLPRMRRSIFTGAALTGIEKAVAVCTGPTGGCRHINAMPP